MSKRAILTAFILMLLLSAMFGTGIIVPVAAGSDGNEPVYVGIAEYYDNRKCVVTVTMDDLYANYTKWEQGLSMFTQKQIYHTAAVITNQYTYGTNWSYIQYWVDQGYTEIGSHSRNHVHTPYTGTEDGKDKVSYEWQISGSKKDIIGNLTLPDWWRYGDNEYVYAWIEPYGDSDSTVRWWLGQTFYLCDRDITSDSVWATWDSANGLFNRIGYSIEMGDKWGTNNIATLNNKFDSVYSAGGIYHLTVHPIHVDWSQGNYADMHTDYISSRTDVWYVPFGLLYLYHWVAVRNIVNVTSTGSGHDKIFELNVKATVRQNYGVSYPITYVFDIPPSWSTGYVYYRFRETDPWMLMANKNPTDFFNGITAARFDFTNHKAYVSVGFSEMSDEIYLLLDSPTILKVPYDYPTIQEAVNAARPGDTIQVASGVYYENVIVNKKVLLIGESRSTTINGGGTGTVLNVTASDVVVSGFIIQGGVWGISLENSSNCVIKGNTITNNTGGIRLIYGAQGNTIYHNNFINNTSQVFVGGSSNNTWSNGYEGNYWSDYNGTDSDGDGIGDAPYVIDENNQDNYPLMKPYIPGDVNHDGMVDIFDLVLVAVAYGSTPEDPYWNPYADLVRDSVIDIFDIIIVAVNFGKTV